MGQSIVLPSRELAGPVLERDGLPYVVTAVMGAQNNPRGVMVRPWAELVNGTLRGWYLDGVRHQGLQARVNPQGYLVIAGAEFPGSGQITVETVDTSKPMHVVPPETIDPPPPIDPPPTGGLVTNEQIYALLEKVAADVKDIKVNTHEMGDQLGVISDSLTSQGIKLDRVEGHTKAQRDTTTGSIFGTQKGTIKALP